MDYRQRVDEVIEPLDEDTLVIADQRLAAKGEARQWAERLRSVLSKRLFERRPNGTEHTWHHFLVGLRDYARHIDQLSDAVVEDLVTLVDGL